MKKEPQEMTYIFQIKESEIYEKINKQIPDAIKKIILSKCKDYFSNCKNTIKKEIINDAVSHYTFDVGSMLTSLGRKN